ncbi:MAG: lipid-A-disaccharide synthase [Candidatus Omnitrophica bacterium]|nr:lipid-A-disaccharide synthase [Candidatus Omnitrophota bacterium]
MKKIIIIAGDKSGDLYGAMLCKQLKEKYMGVEIFSFGGEHLARHSTQRINLLEHSVSGIFEVLLCLKDLLETYSQALHEIASIDPDLIILIDFPDFNLQLAKNLNNKYHIFYYVSPQVWAWRKRRVESIKRYVNRMIVIFRFEEDFYRKEKMEVYYFGHPLLEVIEKKNIETQKIISLMPGSRKNEIRNHLPTMMKAKEIIEKELPGYKFRIIRPENIPAQFYIKMAPNTEVADHTYQAIEESAFIITSSGTATIEISILEVPFLVIYKLNIFSWHILRKLVKLRFIAMTNILAGRKVVEELIQDKANPQTIAQTALRYLKDEAEYAELKNDLGRIKNILGPRGATASFADSVAKYLSLTKL